MARPPDDSRADISADTDDCNPNSPLFRSLVRRYSCRFPLFLT